MPLLPMMRVTNRGEIHVQCSGTFVKFCFMFGLIQFPPVAKLNKSKCPDHDKLLQNNGINYELRYGRTKNP
jgi:hypothetical protein